MTEGNTKMAEPEQYPKKVDSGFIWIAAVLFLGILVLGWGYFEASRIGFYTGLLLTLAGVFTGIQKFLFPYQRKETDRA